jgi:predicted nucleotidyltransferase component of viral defense system
MATPETWEILFKKALRLIEDIKTHGTKNLYWTFGGGTVLMRRYQHRLSKDIDIFVPDPQALNYVNPRLNDTAEEMTHHYVEANGYIKLFLEEGEIDFVAAPNLMAANAVVEEEIFGTKVLVETSAEIIAKKFYHRGDRLIARDMFDLALVIEKEPRELMAASEFLIRHADAIKSQLAGDTSSLRVQFDAIEKLSYTPLFDEVRDKVLFQLEASIEHQKRINTLGN